MRFFQELSDDSHEWEILGVRKIFALKDPEDLSGEFFCISDQDPITGKARLIKSFTSPIDNIRHFKAGSIWKDGKNITPPNLSYNRSVYKIFQPELILAQEPGASAHEIIERLLDSSTPHRTFTLFTNHLKFSSRSASAYIQCSEIIRHFMSPSKRFLRAVLNGTIDTHFRSVQKNEPSALMPKMNSKELLTTRALSYNSDGLRSVRLPYKSFKLTTLNNKAKNQSLPLLLTSLFPKNSITIKFRFTERPLDTGGFSKDFVAIQIDNTDYLQKYFVDWR